MRIFPTKPDIETSLYCSCDGLNNTPLPHVLEAVIYMCLFSISNDFLLPNNSFFLPSFLTPYAAAVFTLR